MNNIGTSMGNSESSSNATSSTSPVLVVKKLKCAVETCNNDSSTIYGSRSIRLFTPPSSPRMKRMWIEAVPQLADGNFKVCEAHFHPQSHEVNMFPYLNLPARKRKLEADMSQKMPILKLRKNATVFQNPALTKATTSNIQGQQDHCLSNSLPRKVIRVFQKVPQENKTAFSELNHIHAATATVTVSRPLNLTDIMGDKKAKPIVNSVASPNLIRPITMNEICSDKNKIRINGLSPIPTISNSPMNFSNTESRPECHNDCLNYREDNIVSDPPCNNCISQLPAIRKSLGRLESRLDTMLNMARTLLTRATQAGIQGLSNSKTSESP